MNLATNILSTDMKYIIANRKKAESFYLNLIGHRMNDSIVILNEKEVNNCCKLSPYNTIYDKANALDGTVCSYNEVMNIINNGMKI